MRDVVAEHFHAKRNNPLSTRVHDLKEPGQMKITDPDYRLPEGSVLVLRACRADMTSRDGFKWPEEGEVSAPDWSPVAECGQGLHGWLWGVGDLSIASVPLDEHAKWLVVEVSAASVIDLQGKIKFPRGDVRFVGSSGDAADIIRRFAPDPGAVMFGTATAGDSGTATAGTAGTATAGTRGTATAGTRGTATAGTAGTATAGTAGTATAGTRGTATAGDSGTATAGYAGTATAGTRGTATAGDSGTATAGYAGTATAGTRGTATAGDSGTATAGDSGTATAGYAGTATAGDSGTATAGDSGTATAGDSGTATAGDSGTATAGDSGTATAGDSGILILRKWDQEKQRYRLVVLYVGEDGVEPNTPYILDQHGRPVKKESAK